MITVRHTIDFPAAYPLERLGPLSDLLFFDIETTGFSGDTSSLYLIGCACYRENRWQLFQWFADTREAEPELLHAFFSFLQNFSVLVHFNGDGFDIPYLLKRCCHYGLNYDFSGVKSLDIYRKIKPYKGLLGLESVKQKAIERFLGIFRTDPYSGGQLIQVYQDYLVTGEDFLYNMLILHNKEDLEGMPLILPVLNYCDMLEGSFSFADQDTSTIHDIFGTPETHLELTYESACSVPSPWSVSDGTFTLSCDENRLVCSVPLTEGELKYFYPDYKDYYYLPQEDTAVHKSLGEFVDRSARKKATAATCYTRSSGLFLPQPRPVWTPVFKKNYKEKQTYVKYCPELFQDPDNAVSYLDGVLKLLCPKIPVN